MNEIYVLKFLLIVAIAMNIVSFFKNKRWYKAPELCIKEALKRGAR